MNLSNQLDGLADVGCVSRVFVSSRIMDVISVCLYYICLLYYDLYTLLIRIYIKYVCVIIHTAYVIDCVFIVGNANHHVSHICMHL